MQTNLKKPSFNEFELKLEYFFKFSFELEHSLITRQVELKQTEQKLYTSLILNLDIHTHYT